MTSAAAAALPTGTVTFLFTDIEGSTRLLATLGDRFEPVLAAHDRIVRAAVAAQDGIVVNTEGDAFFAVFTSAERALLACVAAQRALHDHEWPADGVVRVRMGLHSGEGRLGGADYVGMDVHRTARIASAAHGGQLLVSSSTRALVGQVMPAGVALRDLGEHRLRDLPEAEHLFQVTIVGLPDGFPGLRGTEGNTRGLPVPETSLVGRETALGEVVALLDARRLVTLTGPGGTGKTRLALAVAHHLAAAASDGARFVALEEATERAEVSAAIAAELGILETPDRDLEAGVSRFLRDRAMLLVLDNFEQVVEAAPLVAELLAAAPRLRLLVTSRAPLRVSGEQLYEVPPLALPDAAAGQRPDVLAQVPAVALFVERARAARHDFTLTEENAGAVEGICRRVDGLPLAIELAAARVRLLPPAAILARLDRRLALLTGGARDLPARQRTLRGAIEWSYDLLDPAERTMLDRLSVFAGGWTPEGAAEVANPGDELGMDTLDLLDSLADKSLVHAGADEEGAARLSMLQTVREFATERLDVDPGRDDVRRRHAEHMAAFAERAEPELRASAIREWQHRLRHDEENLRGALRWTLHHEVPDLGLRIAGSLWHFWHYWGSVREGRRWLESMLALPAEAVDSALRARAMSGLASLVYWQGDTVQAQRLYEEVLAIHEARGDRRQVAATTFDLAWTAVAAGDGPLAMQRARESHAHYDRLGDALGTARVGAWLQTAAYLAGGGGTAEAAVEALERQIVLEREAGNAHEEGEGLGSLAMVYFRAGDAERAALGARTALRRWREVGNVGRFGTYLTLSARLELDLGRPERAVQLGAAARRFNEEVGGSLPAALTQVGDYIEDARSQLSPEVYAAALDAGRSMSIEAALELALAE
jgi:predicted ATPase/class 3 adenylate cyclase